MRGGLQQAEAAQGGAVYVLSNQAAGNSVQVYHRADDGSLSFAGSVPTGGLGTITPPLPAGAAGIDPLAVADIQKIIAKLKAKGIGIIISDHNVRETLSCCDRAYIVNEGEILVEGAPEVIADSELARKFYFGEDFSL